MDFFGEGFREAFRLLFAGDADTWHAIFLSLWTSFLALALGGGLGVPLGTWLGVVRPRGGRVVVFVLYVGMAMPTVVIGLLLYGLFSRRGPLAGLDLLYTPWAIVIGQALLAFPIFASLAHGAASGLDRRVLETARTHGGGTALTMRLALGESRTALVAATMLAFGRCVTELGIALAVGGSIRMHTRTLPSLITLDTSRGEFGRALAAGAILVLLACGAAAVAFVILGKSRR
jgi:tungstate transport system permease protein